MSDVPRRIILDCDTGSDDAIAIMLAVLHPDLDLLGVTTVWGNAPVEVTTENTRRVLAYVGRADVPVLRGAAGPRRPPPPLPEQDHRPRHLDLAPATGPVRTGTVLDWLAETLHASTDPVTVVATGPLTNLAEAVAKRPQLVEEVGEVVVMGGSRTRPGVTSSAERNFYNDAPAARAVLGAGFRRLVLVTLDATYEAALDEEDAHTLGALDTPAGTLAAALLGERIGDYARVPGLAGRAAPVHDPLAVASLVDPAVVGLRPAHVTVEVDDPATRGRSVIDLDRAGTPTALVALTADRDRYVDLLTTTFARGRGVIPAS